VRPADSGTAAGGAGSAGGTLGEAVGGTSCRVGSSAVYVYVSLGRYSYSGRGGRRQATVVTNIVAVSIVATRHHIPTPLA
jgi:hypothetical protein